LANRTEFKIQRMKELLLIFTFILWEQTLNFTDRVVSFFLFSAKHIP